MCGPAVTNPLPSDAPGSLAPLSTLGRTVSRAWLRLVAPLLLTLLALTPIDAALAVSLKDLPSSPPAAALLDAADVFSRGYRGEIENQL